MSDKYIAEHCAPTLAGIKTGNLFTVRNDREESVTRELRRLNRCFRKKGLRVIPVKQTASYTLVYIYRPERLKRDLSDDRAKAILRKKGYAIGDVSKCIRQLADRLSVNETFPHEIGLFLGYPPLDVQGFMEHPREGVKCSGIWKVYSDERAAKKTFLQYKRCTSVYCKRIAGGQPLEKMVV